MSFLVQNGGSYQFVMSTFTRSGIMKYHELSECVEAVPCFLTRVILSGMLLPGINLEIVCHAAGYVLPVEPGDFLVLSE